MEENKKSIINIILAEHLANKQTLEQLLKSAKKGDIILLKCESAANYGEKYEAIGRIKTKYDLDGDVPQGLLLERQLQRASGQQEFVPYSHIRSFEILAQKNPNL
jgi:hypothetical protein